MNISITAGEPQAKPDSNATIKAGGALPITITFDVSPGSSPAIELTMGSQSSSPATLAFTSGFTEQDATTFTGVLDCNDSRLITAISGFATLPVNCEVRWSIGGGEPVVCPNFTLTVQPPLITGAGTSDGGPTYVTTAMLASALAALASDYAPIDGSGNVLVGTRAKLVAITNGFKVQTSEDGITWTDGDSFTS